jgi:hypothetical protein
MKALVPLARSVRRVTDAIPRKSKSSIVVKTKKKVTLKNSVPKCQNPRLL